MKKYRPSNGTEGEGFIDEYCMHCLHEKYSHTYNEDDKKCEILTNTMIYDINEPEYPEEWIYDENGNPCCTAYIPHEWNINNDDDNDDFWKPPPKVPVPDNQLCFPFVLDEIVQIEEPQIIKL